MSLRRSFETHEVLNQSPLFENINLFTSDIVLQEAVTREGGAWAKENLEAFGKKTGTAHAFDLGRLANENLPKLRAFDAKGFRLDTVEFHPAYHELMQISMAQGLHCSPWDYLKKDRVSELGAHVARCAGSYMAAQMDAGHCCPITMTHASVATLLHEESIAKNWIPRILGRDYDPAFKPAHSKTAVTIGMGMTEKQGGTDVRANTTRAEPIEHASKNGPGGEYLITGHKWFMSAPMCDAFLVLAQAPGGLSCFFMPRFLPDDSVNALHFLRLKEKLGNRSNASSEVEFRGAHGWLIGEEGRGVPAIIDMVTFTRLDCAIASAGMMRLGLAHAIHHTSYRTAFQKKLIDQPLMIQVLADLALDVEAATALAFRLARSFDNPSDEKEAAFKRLMTPVIKYWVCKIAPAFAYEAMECLGGNGYVEEGMLARLYREVPVNAIWEGSGNVMCLDVLRVLQHAPESTEIVLQEIAPSAQDDKRFEAALSRVKTLLADPSALERNARDLVNLLAVIAAAHILKVHAPHAVADAFIASRLAGSWRQTHGTGLKNADVKAIVGRASPVNLS